MKKILALLVVATVVTSVTGCGCCRRLRDTICRGAFCGSPAPVAVAPVAPVAIAPPCGCEGAPIAMDAGCGFPAGIQTTAFGSVPCDTCSGGSFSLPGSSDVIYDSPGFLSSPTTLDPGPAPSN